jgi:hypothetical protein
LIEVVPEDTPFTTPLELTVATPGTLDSQGVEVDGEPDPVKVMLVPTQTVEPPDIVGNGNTVTCTSSVAIHPFPSTPTTVYVFVEEGEKATLFETLLFQLKDVPVPTAADNDTDSPKHVLWSAPAFTVGNMLTVKLTETLQLFPSV